MSVPATAGPEHDRTGASTGDPCWLDTRPEPIYAVLHSPAHGATSRFAALILPAFGWDDECSYRRRRDWAVRLADSGITAARIDFPGSESSAGSPLAPDRLGAWLLATEEAACWLRERSGCERLTAIGIGLGGLVAYEAAARGAALDDLLLWGVRSSGRAFIRELRAYAAVTDHSEDPGSAANDGETLGIGGHVMSAATAQALSEIDLTELELPQAELRRVMLVGRDAHGIDRRLHDHLIRSGTHVTVVDSQEYGRMMSPPDLALEPTATVAASIEWLGAAAACEQPAHPNSASPPCESPTARFAHDGVEICEQLVAIETRAGRLAAVISEPVAGPRAPFCLVTVNSGGLRNTGPNRMFVEVARRAAAAGIPAARVDLPGLGDSDGVAIKSFERRAEDEAGSLATLAEIYGELTRLGVAERFVAGGFSLGGYLTVRAALADSRVIAAISANPSGFTWTVKQRRRAARDFIAMAGPEALAPPRQPPAGTGPLSALLESLSRRRRRLEARARHELARVDFLWRLEHRRELSGLRAGLDQLRGSGTRMLLLLSSDEQLLRMLEQPGLAEALAACPNMTVERLPDDDHLLRPLWVQKRVIDRFVSALVELRSAAAPTATANPKRSPRPRPQPPTDPRVRNEEV